MSVERLTFQLPGDCHASLGSLLLLNTSNVTLDKGGSSRAGRLSRCRMCTAQNGAVKVDGQREREHGKKQREKQAVKEKKKKKRTPGRESVRKE